jgi:hypothetical protein
MGAGDIPFGFAPVFTQTACRDRYGCDPSAVGNRLFLLSRHLLTTRAADG